MQMERLERLKLALALPVLDALSFSSKLDAFSKNSDANNTNKFFNLSDNL